MTRVSFDNVHFSVGETPILRGVDLEIEPGRFCVFVGPSGCGKSTLLRLLAGLETPDRGDIRIDGRSVRDIPAARRNVAMVFQGYALYPHMSVYDNMAFALRRAGVPRAEIEQRVRAAARSLQLDGLLERRPRSLSGGQQQRAAIGRAIVKKPQVFLFDEPLSNLDAALRVQTRVEIARLHRELPEASMLYVTHDQVEAMTLADTIVLLRPLAGGAGAAGAGSVAQVGPPLSLYHRPANLYAAGFIGTPAMNLLPARVAGANGAAAVLELAGARCEVEARPATAAADAAVTLGIRPEHLRIGDGPWQAEVLHLEALGEHAVLHLRLGAELPTVLAKTTDERVRIGDRVRLGFPASAAHVFGADGLAWARP